MQIYKNITLCIFIYILCAFSYGQNISIPHTRETTTKTLLSHGYYTMWGGQPWEYSNGIEVPGYTDLDRRLLFTTDTTFEEIIFKEDIQILAPDACDTFAKKKNVTSFFIGKWDLHGDTINLRYANKYIYPEREFSNCFYLTIYKKFKCSLPPLCISIYENHRVLTIKNEKLCEVHDIGECYR